MSESEKTKRGRPRKPLADPFQLTVLTIPEALRYFRKLKRGISREKLMNLIVSKRLRAGEDTLRNDKFGKPLLVIMRVDLEELLETSVRWPNVASLKTGRIPA